METADLPDAAERRSGRKSPGITNPERINFRNRWTPLPNPLVHRRRGKSESTVVRKLICQCAGRILIIRPRLKFIESMLITSHHQERKMKRILSVILLGGL